MTRLLIQLSGCHTGPPACVTIGQWCPTLRQWGYGICLASVGQVARGGTLGVPLFTGRSSKHVSLDSGVAWPHQPVTALLHITTDLPSE